jgi:hypothetical protein
MSMGVFPDIADVFKKSLIFYLWGDLWTWYLTS